MTAERARRLDGTLQQSFPSLPVAATREIARCPKSFDDPKPCGGMVRAWRGGEATRSGGKVDA